MAKKKTKASKKAPKAARKTAKSARAGGARARGGPRHTAARKAAKATKKSVKSKKTGRPAAKRPAARRPGRAAAPKAAPRRPRAVRPAAAEPAKPPARLRTAPPRPAPAAPPPTSPETLTPPAGAPPEAAEARPRDTGPNFFEPDDLPSAAKPVGEGPFYQNDRRDRPIYDTEAAEEQAGEEEPAEADFGDEEEDELDEEEDDEDARRVPQATGPPAGRPGGRPAAAGQPLTPGTPAPLFTCRDQAGREHALADYRGRYVVLYFYPRDDTPGCTREACGFRDRLGEFEARGTAVLGMSPDSVASHAAFARKFQLPFPLLVDEGHAVAERYGAWGEKPVPGGRQRPGILRTTFIIDPAGRIAHVFRQVKTENHEAAVLAFLDRNRAAAGRP